MSKKSFLFGQPLFFEPELTKEASTALTSDPSNWSNEVMDLLHSTHPFIVDNEITIDLRRVDKEAGHAIGSIDIAGKVTVPVIIKSARLMPLDMFIAKEDMFPLTAANLANSVGNFILGKSDKGLEFQTDSGLTYLSLPPNDTKYAYSTSLSALDYTKDELQGLLNCIGTEDIQFALRNNSAFKEAIAKYASGAKEPVIQKQASSTFTLVPIVTANDMQKLAYGPASVLTEEKIPGFVFDSVWDLTTGKEYNKLTFISKTAGIKAESNLEGWSNSTSELPHNIPIRQATGKGHILYKSAGKYRITDEVTVLYKTAQSVIVSTSGAKTVEIKELPTNDAVLTDDVLYIKQAAFVPVAQNIVPLSKIAADALLSSKYDVRLTTNGNGFYKVATEIPELTNLNAVFTLPELLSTLEPMTSIASIRMLKEAMKAKNARVGFKASQTKAVEKTAATFLDDTIRGQLLKVATLITPEVAKHAGIPDQAAQKTVDAVLGLGFLSEENINKLVDYNPVLKEAQNAIGKIIIAARLGMPFDVSAATSAFSAVARVSRGLDELKSNSDD